MKNLTSLFGVPMERHSSPGGVEFWIGRKGSVMVSVCPTRVPKRNDSSTLISGWLVEVRFLVSHIRDHHDEACVSQEARTRSAAIRGCATALESLFRARDSIDLTDF